MSDRRQRTRVRCSDCGSTRVRAITTGYLDGRLVVGESGRVEVDEGGAWVAHELDRIEPGSVLCENCGSDRYRIERPAKAPA
jgi:hypothetical protein